MRRMPTVVPIAIIRQGGKQVIIGEVLVGDDGQIKGHILRQAVDDVVLETLGTTSFALYVPRQILRRLYRRKGRHQRETLTIGA